MSTATLVVPRFVTNPEGGFAAGSSAIVTLLIMLGATFVFSLYLLAATVQQYGKLSIPARLAGIGPSLVLGATVLILFGFLGY